jgi:excisionase family DNA binding protein
MPNLILAHAWEGVCGIDGGAPMDTPRLIDIKELSRRLSIPRGTLYNWVYLRRIPFIKAGRSLRFDAGRGDPIPASLRYDRIGWQR